MDDWYFEDLAEKEDGETQQITLIRRHDSDAHRPR